MKRFLFGMIFATASLSAALTVSVLTKDGKTAEGVTTRKKVTIRVNGARRELALDRVLSIHNGAAASEYESGRIAAGLTAIQGADRPNRDAAVEELAAIGIPVLSPLLKTYKDTDAHEPRPLYRLFARVMPSKADDLDRTLSLVRLAGGEMLRGELEAADWDLGGTKISAADIRRVAVRQKAIVKRVEVQALTHCNQIEYFDTGIILSSGSKTDVEASGFTRLSWDTDSWATGPDGLKKPGGNYKTNLVNGQPFGALVGRLGVGGAMFAVGSRYSKAGIGPGRFYLAINDNAHWQNNLGSYHVTVRVTDGYDVGEGQ